MWQAGANKTLHALLLIVCEVQWYTGFSLNVFFEFVGQLVELNSFVKLSFVVFEFVVANLQKLNFQFPTSWPAQQTRKPSSWELFRRRTFGKRIPGRDRAWLRRSTSWKPEEPCRRSQIRPEEGRFALSSLGTVLSGP